MNRPGTFVTVLALGTASLLTACGNSQSGATGAMFIESCGLNCSSNGSSGGQVSCGVISIFQNQEIGVLFSKPVEFNSVSNQSFVISETLTGAIPIGAFVQDPFDDRRVIFRPDLSFDINGNPVFGFRANTSYDIFIPGTGQGDQGPHIRSTGGNSNSSRLACTVSTDLGIADPVAGPPIGNVFVSTPSNPKVPANGATNVLLTSKVTIVFNDLMNIGTLVLPGAGSSTTISVKLDPDGNVANTLDQIALQGTFTFNLDQLALQTTVVFTPAQPFPSAGANLASPRKIIVDLDDSIKDLKGNGLGNPGPVSFTPQALIFPPVVIPPGGEQFTSLANCDQDSSGLSWGESTPGRLTPGLGGGSGRLGDLKIRAGEVVTLRTGPTFGVGRIVFQSFGPLDGDTVNINGVEWSILDGTGTSGTTVEFENQFPSLTMTNLVNALNNSLDPLVSPATYALEDNTTLRITFDTPGATGPAFTFEVYRIGLGGVHNPASSVISMSGPIVPGGTGHMLEGVDNETFAAGNLLDNFDFQANPGITPNPILVANGAFEFASLEIDAGGVLRLEGPNPARVLVRGNAVLNGLIDVSGQSKGAHQSDSPRGQPGGFGGPNAGDGGVGADRPDNSGSDLLSAIEPFRPWDFGIVNLNNSLSGAPGVGVGQVGTIAAGPQGLPYPGSLPNATQSLGAMETNAACESEQVGAVGGGGAYSLDGGIGIAVAATPVAMQGSSNTPQDTSGGDATNVGLEPPGAPPNKRKLTPEKGFLKGGSGGGGGGTHVSQTRTNGLGGGDPCIDVGASINRYRSHSANGGGGGGGGIQVQAGRSLTMTGGIDASGGDGGSADSFGTMPSAVLSAPGGAGSGGAILVQAKQLLLSTQPNRMSIAGGLGGAGFFALPPPSVSGGGSGGPGLARVEAEVAPLALDIAAILDPVDPLDPTSLNYLSVGTFVRARQTPASFQGAQSCWMRPAGNFFALQLDPDGATPGWDMDLILNFGAGPVTVPYRSPNGILPGGQTFEQFWGQLLDADLQLGEVGAPIVVRFQGAKLIGAMPDPCNVVLSGPGSPLSPGSLSPWVRHPAELNDFPAAPDMIRFAIIFDASKLEFLKVVGVTNLRVHGLPN